MIEPDAGRTAIEISADVTEPDSADVTEPDSVDGRGDFALLRHPEATMQQYLRRAALWWMAGGAALLASFVLLLVAVFCRGRLEL